MQFYFILNKGCGIPRGIEWVQNRWEMDVGGSDWDWLADRLTG